MLSAALRRTAAATLLAAAIALAPVDRYGILHLLNQRTVQTQVYYSASNHDECKANWLANFGEPEVTMACERISDRAVQPKYHGLDAFCAEGDEDPADYLREMLMAEPVTFEVRYLVGTPDGGPAPDAGGAPDGFAEQSSAAMAMWGGNAAAASRRRNPYLGDSKRYIEYEETIVPAKLARLLMRTREQLAREWAWDLRKLIRKRADPDAAGAVALKPPGIDEDASPLRYANLDLCARLATREAAVAAVKRVSAADARFLKAKLAPEVEAPAPQEDADDLPEAPAAAAAEDDDGSLSRELAEIKSKLEVEAPAPDSEDDDDEDEGSLSRELAEIACNLQWRSDALGDHCSSQGKADRFLADLSETAPFETQAGSLVDPPAIARTILEIRDSLLETWADNVIPDVVEEHTGLCREVLERQLRSGDGASPGDSPGDDSA